MTPERTAALVARWVRHYTRHLPSPLAERRRGEIAADLHDHIAHERARGVGEARIALSLAARMLRGLPADLAWRRQVTARHTTANARRSALRVLALTVVVLLVPLAAMQLTDEVRWSVADFVVAGALVAGTGLLFELAARRPGGLVPRAVAAAIGVAAAGLGEADDAPGLVLFGVLAVAGAVAPAVRAALRR